jgi:hypothetical protein
MSRLHRLFDEQGQSPWLDSRGVLGVTANPTRVAKATKHVIGTLAPKWHNYSTR